MSPKRIENSEARSESAEALSRAVESLKRGEVIVFPTETFYGLGADAFNAAAVEHVFSLKGRSPNVTIPILIADEEMLKDVVRELSPLAMRFMHRFWPGPLTLVLPGKKGLPPGLLNSEGGVGVRISSHPLATQLVRDLGHPLTATSANPSAKAPARTVQDARIYFSEKLEIFLGEERLHGTKGSTVVEVHQDGFKIIREGEIGLGKLENVRDGYH
ncbi:MAG: L-threonylcarbamoyladenylate synthase [Candidatus Binatia bacterium]